MTPPAPTTRRLLSTLAIAAASVTLLAGCALFGGDDDGADPGDSPAPSTQPSTASPSQQPSQSTTPTQTPTPTPTPVTLGQDEVWTAQQVYDYNPNFSDDPSYAVASGSEAAKLVALQGVGFGWVNQTSGDTIEVAVAHPARQLFAQYEGAVALQHKDDGPVPIDNDTTGSTAFFTPGTGTLDVFTKSGYWLVVSSKTFAEPGDSYPIAVDVIGNVSK